MSLEGKGKWLGNCHSYTLWQLTGKMKIDVSFNTILQTLKNLKYESQDISSNPHYVQLKTTDVITFGRAHSGFVLIDGKISHLRKTQFQNILNDGSLISNSEITIPIDPVILYRYPGEYINWLKKHGANHDEIEKAVKGRKIGFYRLRDTFKDIQNAIPAYADTLINKIRLWRKADTSRGFFVRILFVRKDEDGYLKGQVWMRIKGDIESLELIESDKWYKNTKNPKENQRIHYIKRGDRVEERLEYPHDKTRNRTKWDTQSGVAVYCILNKQNPSAMQFSWAIKPGII